MRRLASADRLARDARIMDMYHKGVGTSAIAERVEITSIMVARIIRLQLGCGLREDRKHAAHEPVV